MYIELIQQVQKGESKVKILMQGVKWNQIPPSTKTNCQAWGPGITLSLWVTLKAIIAIQKDVEKVCHVYLPIVYLYLILFITF